MKIPIEILVVILLLMSTGMNNASQADNNNEICLSIRQPIQQQPVGEGACSAGPPGKMGPPGPQGPKGDPGALGPQGICNKTELEELKRQLVRVMGFPSLKRDMYESDRAGCSVGLKDGRVPDNGMTASGTYPEAVLEPYFARLDHQHCWAAPSVRAGDWVQTDLGIPTRVTGVITQGRHVSDQWVTEFKISFSDDGIKFTRIPGSDDEAKVFPGNMDRNSYKVNSFKTPVTARYFRIIVVAWSQHPSLRMEYLTC